MSDVRSMIPGDQYLGGVLMFFCRAVRKHLLLVILLPLAAMAIAYFAAPHLPPLYTAQGSIRIGRVDGTDAMSVQNAVARLISQSFKQRLARAMNLPTAEHDRSAQLVLGSLTAKPEMSDTLAVSVRALTEQQARQAVDATIGLLNEEQDKIRGPVTADINAQIAIRDASIAIALEMRDSLSALEKDEPKVASGDPTSMALRRVWLSDLLSRNEERLATARTERQALAARLGTTRTYPTALVEDVLVSPTSSSPRPVTLMIFAGFAAFVAALVYALTRGATRRR
jgi:hypothetical protein